MTKEPRGRERRVRGNPEALPSVRTLLDELEAVRLARLDRLADVLDEPDEGGTR